MIGICFGLFQSPSFFNQLDHYLVSTGKHVADQDGDKEDDNDGDDDMM
ncbi:hypothetical protein HanRHA438_Chr08g0361481 [Helianthus annuus]|uniref:Uncharacterized protein n=1 Tax=Helianthus annuus TaxID=4232 RepID=A0A9K3IGS1_HELAN|nr:hypothetical protein HanXRQr2_Chr08g0349041 [Helianthus annuus]KAJ0898850.1 hypothetical protein HanRHA438_Chr08g0361481 [Helianthus annuus]KAJ0902463.1 hypothetical protein HanPSC8_Chr08g0337341 [Helianthus annuus]